MKLDNIETLQASLLPKLSQPNFRAVPESIRPYANIAGLYERSHTTLSGTIVPFFEKPIPKGEVKKCLKKYLFLTKLSQKKARDWILENVSERDFLEMVAASISTAISEDQAALEQLDSILADVYWNPWIVGHLPSEVKGLPNFRNAVLDRLDPKSQEILNCIRSGADWYDRLFHTFIYPNAILDSETSSHFGYSKEENFFRANLIYSSTPAGFEAVKQEHKSLLETPQNVRETPLKKLRAQRKRVIELGLIFVYLMPLTNAKEMQAQAAQVQMSNFMAENFQMNLNQYSSLLNIFYGMVHGEEMPEHGFCSPYSIEYYPNLVVPVLHLLKSQNE